MSFCIFHIFSDFEVWVYVSMSVYETVLKSTRHDQD